MIYGVNINKSKKTIVVIGEAVNNCQQPIIFAIQTRNKNMQCFLTAAEIRECWNHCMGDLLSGNERITIKEAKRRGIEVL